MAETRSNGVIADKTPLLMRHIRSDHFKSLLIMYSLVRSLRRLLNVLIYPILQELCWKGIN